MSYSIPDENRNDSIVYVIDKDYKVVYFNPALKSVCPSLKEGDYCYNVLGKEASPCEKCPINVKDKHHVVFFNPNLHGWIDIKVADMDWPGAGHCHLLVANRIEDVNHDIMDNIQELSAYDDFLEINQLTGLYSFDAFFKKAEEYLLNTDGKEKCCIAFDIEHFKLINEWYGRETGDKILKHIADCIKNAENNSGGVSGYLNGDNFCFITDYDTTVIENIYKEISEIDAFDKEQEFLPSMGVYVIKDQTMPVASMYDRAVIAINSVKSNHEERIIYYNHEMLEEIEHERKLLNEILHGLEEEEFTFFLQPQCNMETGQIVGAEALSRWVHPEKGLVSPAVFIPALEKNDLIPELDLYTWERVFKWQSGRIKNKEQLIPISVNVSRVDFKVLDVPDVFRKLAKKYNVSPFFVEVEITESSYAEDDSIQNAITRLQNYGFRILIDDFGSGYSSFNMLKTTTVDMIKLDMQLIETNESNVDKTLEILRSFKNMTYKLKIPNIVEGVSSEEQRQMLLDINYHYGQGFHFYRPMPVGDFEKLLENEDNLDLQGIRLRHNKNLLNGIWSEVDVQDILNSMPGGFFIYKNDEDKTLLFASEVTPSLFGCSSMSEFKKYVGNSFKGMVHPDDYERVHKDISTQIGTSRNKMDYVKYRIKRKDGKAVWVDDYGHYMQTENFGDVFYVFLADATKRHIAEQRLTDILNIADVNGWEWDIQEKKLTLENISSKSDFPAPLDFLNSRTAVVYDFPELIRENKLIPSDYEQVFSYFTDRIRSGYKKKMSLEIPFNTSDGKMIWFSISGKTEFDSHNNPVRVTGTYRDISNYRQIIAENKQNLRILQRLKSSAIYDFHVNLTSNKMSNGSSLRRWCLDTGFNTDIFTQITHYTAENLVDPEFKEKFLEFIDIKRILKRFTDNKNHEESFEYKRIINGQSKWVKAVIHSIPRDDSGDTYIYYIITDIDKEKRKNIELTIQAKFDSLTGLYNRHSTISKIEKYLNKKPCETSAMIIFDIDNFKLVNDVFSHLQGDTALASVASKIKSFFREKDIVGRLGGDEFLVFCQDISRDVLEKKLADIIDKIAVTLKNNDKDYLFSLSAGYVMTPDDGATFEELYKKADTALYEAKADGKRNFKAYDNSMYVLP